MDKRKAFSLIKKMRTKVKGSVCIDISYWSYKSQLNLPDRISYRLSYFVEHDVSCNGKDFDSLKELEEFILNFKETPDA